MGQVALTSLTNNFTFKRNTSFFIRNTSHFIQKLSQVENNDNFIMACFDAVNLYNNVSLYKTLTTATDKLENYKTLLESWDY